MTDVETPTRREELERLRVTLVAAIEGAGARDLAPLARELRQVMAELEGMAAPRSEPSPACRLASVLTITDRRVVPVMVRHDSSAAVGPGRSPR